MHDVGLQARAGQCIVFSGRAMLVCGNDGTISGDGDGFFVEGTRLLSRHELRVDGRPVEVFLGGPVKTDGYLGYGRPRRRKNGAAGHLSIEITRFVGEAMREVVRIVNYDQERTASVDLEVTIDADFADFEEVRSRKREQSAPVLSTWDAGERTLSLRYHHPEIDRAVVVRVVRGPAALRRKDGLSFHFEIAAHDQEALELVYTPVFDRVERPAPRDRFDGVTTSLDRVHRALRGGAPRLRTTCTALGAAWERAVGDLSGLALGLANGPAVPAAGIPGYQALFGRDTLMIGWQAAMAVPDIVPDTLRLLATYQGTRIDDWRDEEPGKMLHQRSWRPLAALHRVPFDRYYGDYSAPQHFLHTLARHYAWTGDAGLVRELLPTARATLAWLDRYGDADGDGFLEYVTRSSKGLENQGWKDSSDAIVDEHGDVVHAPIATAELQGYWYAALRQLGLVLLRVGPRSEGVQLLLRAEDLRRRFEAAFWLEDLGVYAMALGPDKQPLRSIASNAGHLLAVGMVRRDRARRTADRLMRPDMFSGWGIRTLSREHPRFDPFSYHLGSVWPVENAVIARGFARYGFTEHLQRLIEGQLDAADLFVDQRLPETLGGLPRDAHHPHPGIYPESNAVQGWSGSAVVAFVEAMLGLCPVAPLGLLLVDPHLPPSVPDLELCGVRVGGASLDLVFQRAADGSTAFHVRRERGHVRVVRAGPHLAHS